MAVSKRFRIGQFDSLGARRRKRTFEEGRKERAQKAAQQSAVLVARSLPAGASVVGEALLRLLPDGVIDDGIVHAGVDRVSLSDAARVADVREEPAHVRLRERATLMKTPLLGRPRFHRPAARVQFPRRRGQ